jgi:hypothetical protein
VVPHTWAGNSPWLAAHCCQSPSDWPPRVSAEPSFSNQSENSALFADVSATLPPLSHSRLFGWLSLYFPALLSTACTPWLTAHTGSCGYLGSQEMTLHPKQVASTGANGKADCGVTFHQPGNWTIAATLNWRTCWVPEVVYSPPPATCNPVPGANLNPVTWTRTVAVHEIQAANGSGA